MELPTFSRYIIPSKLMAPFQHALDSFNKAVHLLGPKCASSLLWHLPLDRSCLKIHVLIGIPEDLKYLDVLPGFELG